MGLIGFEFRLSILFMFYWLENIFEVYVNDRVDKIEKENLVCVLK